MHASRPLRCQECEPDVLSYTVSPLSSHHQDAPVQTQVRQALARPRMAHALRPSAASSQRIIGDLRSTKWSTRREERYRIVSSHRTGLSGPAEQQPLQTDAPEEVEEAGKEQDKWGPGEIQVVDLLHEDAEDRDKSSGKVSYCSWLEMSIIRISSVLVLITILLTEMDT